jgi:thymidine kinase
MENNTVSENAAQLYLGLGESGAPLPAVPERLYRLSASCPRCGSRPAMRVTQDVIEAARDHHPQVRLGTYQCQRRGCGTIYDLTASAYQKAS